MGLIHALRSSAEAALGDDDGPLRVRAARDGVRGEAAASRSLTLLEMLHERTAGNLNETERDTLWSALRSVRARLEAARAGLQEDPAGVALPVASEPGDEGGA